MMYFIKCSGLINGRRCEWFAERDTDRMGFSNTVDDIMRGQVEHVKAVYAADDESDSWQPVSDEICQEIANRLNSAPEGELKELLEEIMGCEFVAQIERDMVFA
jgi:hypothetical protein